MKQFAEVAAPGRQLKALALVLLSLASLAAAKTLNGTATNGTTGKPAAGDEIILINLSNGMEVAAKTKADSTGKFSFTLPEGPGPHLIRAVHQGVTYHQIVPAGTNSVAVKVYDVAEKIDGIAVIGDVTNIQADNNSLQGVRVFAVNNNSSPPRTQMNDHNFEFYLPPGAKIQQIQARTPHGQPINTEVKPQSEKNRYAILFPLRPGETLFRMVFIMPYSGQAKLDLKPLYRAENVGVILPKSMQFQSAKGGIFQPMEDPSLADTNAQVVQQVQPGQALGFTVKGTGSITELPPKIAAGAVQQPPQARNSRPSGGLGAPANAPTNAPINVPDPWQEYRWPILGAVTIILIAGGYVSTKRQSAALGRGFVAGAASHLPAEARVTPRPSLAPISFAPQLVSAPAARSSILLEELKEEMFQLELERQQGKITLADYEEARAAFEHNLDCALKQQS